MIKDALNPDIVAVKTVLSLFRVNKSVLYWLKYFHHFEPVLYFAALACFELEVRIETHRFFFQIAYLTLQRTNLITQSISAESKKMRNIAWLRVCNSDHDFRLKETEYFYVKNNHFWIFHKIFIEKIIFNASRSPLITNFKPLCLSLESNREFFCCILGQSEKFFRIIHHFSAKEFDCRFQADQNGCLKMFRK